jgi:hypothetical protein
MEEKEWMSRVKGRERGGDDQVWNPTNFVYSCPS